MLVPISWTLVPIATLVRYMALAALYRAFAAVEDGIASASIIFAPRAIAGDQLLTLSVHTGRERLTGVAKAGGESLVTVMNPLAHGSKTLVRIRV